VKSVVGDRIAVPLSRLLLEKLPFFALTIASCAVTFLAQRSGGAIESLEGLPVSYRIANAIVSYAHYLVKALWPCRLAVFYPLQKWSTGEIAGAGAILLGVSAWVIWRARREPQFVVGWLWYLGTLVPVIGLVQAGSQSMADRYTYLPLIGVFTMAAWLIPNAALGKKVERMITAGVAAVILILYAVLCRWQIQYWSNGVTLFEHALAVTTNNWVAHNNLGAALKLSGKRKEAAREFAEAVRINPKDPYAQVNLGIALLEVGQISDAIPHLEQAVRIMPESAVAQNTVGVAYLNAGEVQKATAHFERAMELDPGSADPHYNLGLILRRAGKVREAIAQFEQAVRLKPDFTKAQQDLARLRAAQSADSPMN
jgi:Flp pilus assembly protein TadD